MAQRLPSLLGALSVVMLVPLAVDAKSDKPAKADKAASKTAPAAKGPSKPEAAALPDAFSQTPESNRSFEDLLKDAVPVKDFATLIEPLYARCDDPDPLYKRQCEVSKTFLLDYLNTHTFVAEADMPPDTSPYDAAAKQVDMEISGCLV
ncbi:MAG TPA: hypothetical protein PKW11_10535, partial [Pseudomonadota bacterium]|nr:hypothetical protein [Pseudomonadota bacterium]